MIGRAPVVRLGTPSAFARVDLRWWSLEAMTATFDASLDALLAETKAVRAILEAGYAALEAAKANHRRAPTLDSARAVAEIRRTIVAAEARCEELIRASDDADAAWAALKAARAAVGAEWQGRQGA